MGRVEQKQVKPKRLLSKHTGLSWKGKMYGRGDEDKLPADFPMDGPHWSDWDGKFEKDSIYTKSPHVEPRKPSPLQMQGTGGARTKSKQKRDDDPSYSRDDDEEGDEDENDEGESDENDAETKRPGYDSYDTASGEHEDEDEGDVQPEIEPETKPAATPAAKPARKSAAKKGSTSGKKRTR